MRMHALVFHEPSQIHCKDFFCTICHKGKNEVFLTKEKNAANNQEKKCCDAFSHQPNKPPLVDPHRPTVSP